MNRTFDFYEYAGIIVPGAVLVLGALWLMPAAKDLLGSEGVTFGELGVFVIIAYAAGQLVQGVGNALEWVLWKSLGGWPNRKVLLGRVLTDLQTERLERRLQEDGIITGAASDVTHRQIRTIVREVYVRVSAAGLAGRVDTFNGNYGLLRGLAAALLVIGVGSVLTGQPFSAVIVLIAGLGLSVQRMHRFGIYYGRELFIAYITMRSEQ